MKTIGLVLIGFALGTLLAFKTLTAFNPTLGADTFIDKNGDTWVGIKRENRWFNSLISKTTFRLSDLNLDYSSLEDDYKEKLEDEWNRSFISEDYGMNPSRYSSMPTVTRKTGAELNVTSVTDPGVGPATLSDYLSKGMEAE